MQIKAPSSELDYPISYTLESGETISESVWGVTPSGSMAVKSGSPTITGLIAACIVTGGDVGKVYELTNTITTSGNRKHSQTIGFRIGAVETN